MKTTYAGLSILAAVALSFATSLPATAAEAQQPTALSATERAEAREAATLLDQAVEYLQKNGPEQAWAAFNRRDGGFVNGPYYVYAVDAAGMMYANGGSPETLAGKNTLDLRDAAGKPLIRELLQAASASDSGAITYRWLNRSNNHVENKTAEFRKVGAYVLAVGYYLPRATREQAEELLEKAVAEVKTAGAGPAYAAFNDPRGGFVRDDLYVFAIGLKDGKYRAYGAVPQLSGQPASELRDAAGKPMVRQMIALAKKKGSGQVSYVWRNPATNAVESKHTVIRRVNDVLLGVGYYEK